MFTRKLLQKLLLTLLLSAWLLPAGQVFAAQPDVRLVVDISGSMKETDPNNLRIPATNLLIDLLPADSQAGIWTYGAYVNMLVSHGRVTENWRRNARQQATKVNSVALFTDIENAIERAAWDMGKTTDGGERHIVLLSDGLVDISEATTAEQRAAENQQSRDHLLRNLVPKLADAGYVIHTLALSDEADLDLMSTMAQRTGGLHAIAYTANDLMPLLLQIMNRFVPSEEVPLQDNRFLIDPTIDEFTVLVFHAPGASATLHDPSNQQYTREQTVPAIRWHGNQRYTMITVNKPAAGQWYIETPEHPDNRVTVISDIRFHSSGFPPTVYRGYPQQIEAWFTEEGRAIDRREFLGLLDVKVNHHKAERQLASFGMPLAESRPRYVATISQFPELGEQSIKIEVDGKTFRRQVVHSFNVQDVVAASLQLPEDGSAPRVILRSQHPDLKPDDIRFNVTANGEPLAAEYRGDGEWKVDLAGLDRSRDHTLAVQVQGQMQGQALNIDLPEMQLQASGAPASDAPPAFVPNPVPQAIPTPVIPVPEETPPVAEPVPAVTAEPEVDEAVDEVAESDAEGGSLLGGLDLSPIESWEDPRMLWIYIALGVANILLFLVAFMMYRRFVNKRKARRDAMDQQDNALADLDDDMELDLDAFDDDDRR